MRVIIAGGRDFDDYDHLKKMMDDFHKLHSVTEVVSGKARGADSLGEKWAKENNVPITGFPARWDLFGKAAGPIRNQEMADYADALVAFWDGSSPGTKDMIDKAKYLLINHIHYY